MIAVSRNHNAALSCCDVEFFVTEQEAGTKAVHLYLESEEHSVCHTDTVILKPCIIHMFYISGAFTYRKPCFVSKAV